MSDVIIYRSETGTVEALEELIGRGAVRFEGSNRWRRYWAVS